jgi:hypothetical protein
MPVVADEGFMHLLRPRPVGSCVPFGTLTPTCCPLGPHSQKRGIGSDDAVAVRHAGYRSTNAIEVNGVAVTIELPPTSISPFGKSLLRLRSAYVEISTPASATKRAALWSPRAAIGAHAITSHVIAGDQGMIDYHDRSRAAPVARCNPIHYC